MELIENDPDEWISNLEGWGMQMNEFTHVLIHLSKEYDVILDRHKNHLMSSGNNALTNELIQEKLNHRYKKLRTKIKKIKKK